MQKLWSPLILKKNDKFLELDELSNGNIPAIILKQAFSESDCNHIIKKITNFDMISSGPGICNKIGETLNSYINKKNEYFENTKNLESKLERIFDDIDDPRKSMKKLLTTVFEKKVSLARENNFNYSNGVFRFHSSDENVRIHRDCVSFEAPSYNVSKLNPQFSAVLYLQKPRFGGDLVLYRKIWHKEDEMYRVPDFGYSEDVISNAEYVKIAPITGDIIILNPNHYHAVSHVRGDLNRISTGFFFGLYGGSEFFCWS